MRFVGEEIPSRFFAGTLARIPCWSWSSRDRSIKSIPDGAVSCSAKRLVTRAPGVESSFRLSENRLLMRTEMCSPRTITSCRFAGTDDRWFCVSGASPHIQASAEPNASSSKELAVTHSVVRRRCWHHVRRRGKTTIIPKHLSSTFHFSYYPQVNREEPLPDQRGRYEAFQSGCN